MFDLKNSLFSILLKIILFYNFSLVFSHDYDTSHSSINFDQQFFYDSESQETNDSDENISILYSTYYDIFETKLNNTFSQQIHTRDIKSQLSDPTEVYYNLHGNYLIYEMIGFLYIYPLDVNRVNSLGLISEQPLPTSVKANSQLNIDWIHDLLYWVKDKKQILVADVRQLNKIAVMANKFYDYISCLAVNPIDSFVIWFEFDSDINAYILFKSYEDGSNRHQVLEIKTHIKRIEFDYESQRIYFLSTFELFSTTYEGADRQTVVRESHSIFQFEVLSHQIYWIEYNSNQLFRANLSDFKNSQKSVNFNQTINRFKIIDYWRQPIGLNRCLNANCSDICLPVDLTYFRCVCHRTCDDNQDIQLAFKEHHLISTPLTTSTTTTQRPTTSTLTFEVNTTSDQIIFDPIEQLDSFSFNPRKTTEKKDDNPITYLNDDYLYIFKLPVNESSNPGTTHTSNTTFVTPSVKSDDKVFEFKEEVNKSVSDLGNDKKIDFEKQEKHLFEETNRKSNEVNVFTNASNEITSEKTNNASDIDSSNVLIDEIKEYEYHFIPKSLYNPLIYGLILLTTGLFIGSILSAIAIRIYGKHKCRSIYSTNTGTTNRWDSVGFQKAEQNIYFGAKYTVKDESLY